MALVFDWENWWAVGNGHHPVTLPYDEIVQRWYSALHRLHFSVDVVHPRSDLSGYRLVIAPTLYLLDNAGSNNLIRFVDQGGHLLVTAFSDVVDENDAFRRGGFLTQLGTLLGVRLEDFGALAPPPSAVTPKSAGDDAEHPVELSIPGENAAPFIWDDGAAVGQYLAEEIHAADAEVIGTFSDGRLRGRPALTRNRIGSGTAYYVTTIPDDTGMRALVQYLAGESGAQPEIENASPWVEVARLGEWMTLINHGSESAVLSVGSMEPDGPEILRLDPFGWSIVHDSGAVVSSGSALAAISSG